MDNWRSNSCDRGGSYLCSDTKPTQAAERKARSPPLNPLFRNKQIPAATNQKIFVIEVTRIPASPEGETDNMPYCPECGGEMRYSIATKRYACQSCGLTVSHQELIETTHSKKEAIQVAEKAFNDGCDHVQVFEETSDGDYTEIKTLSR